MRGWAEFVGSRSTNRSGATLCEIDLAWKKNKCAFRMLTNTWPAPAAKAAKRDDGVVLPRAERERSTGHQVIVCGVIVVKRSARLNATLP